LLLLTTAVEITEEERVVPTTKDSALLMMWKYARE